jgi:hypothetical protein
VTTIKPGIRVRARALDGELLERTAMTQIIDGDDFPVVWICRVEEWESAMAEDREPEGLPWPAVDVHASEPVVA